MGATIAIICEYNPFHNGHKYQIDKIREAFPDSTIVAVMSGNVTQRAELAMLDKHTRAQVAVSMGVNAVFELPYPFSASSAELFALAGVKIADKIGAQYLSFGSESNDLKYLADIAEAIESDAFEKKIQELISNKSISYISAKEAALEAMGKCLPSKSNDMLAVEYLRAIKKVGSGIIPLPIKREGADYNDTSLAQTMSASAIRKFFYEQNKLLSMPDKAVSIVKEQIENGNYLDKQRADDFLFRHTLMTNPKEFDTVFDTPDGCGYFISHLAQSSASAEEFFSGLSSKTYTSSRLRRLVMYLATGVREFPRDEIFTTLLACDEKGRALIKSIRKENKISILTKQADVKKMTDAEKELYSLSKNSDRLYYTLLKTPKSASDSYKSKPIII